MEALLQVEGVSKRFGGVVAVDDCSFELAPGSLTALIGPNGAGKTTLFNLLSGSLAPDRGRIRFRGHDITNLPPYQRVRLGLGRTFQITRNFPRLTVWENVLVAGPGWDDTEEAGRRYLEMVDLWRLREAYAEQLSYGQGRLLELVRVLMLRPVLLLLDEPMAGVNPVLQARLLELIARLRAEEGKTFLIVEHNMQVVMRHCERVIVMNAGRILADGPPEAIQRNEEVLTAYFGR